jgi:hypothetical protein
MAFGIQHSSTPTEQCKRVMANVPTNFHLFSDLPAELRRKIWATAINSPRLIDPLLSRIDFHSEPPKRYYHCKPPIFLQICKESRDEARLRYHYVSLPGGCDLGPPLYLNPYSDILFLSHESTTRPTFGMLGSFSPFNETKNPQESSAWNSLCTIALCSSHVTWLIEPLCLRFPSLETVYLLQAPEKMANAHLLKGRVEGHLERRREARGDGRISPSLGVKVVTRDELTGRTAEWGEWERDPETGSVMQCKTCLLQL